MTVHYVAMMVVHNPTTDELTFLTRRIHAEALPENTTDGIMNIVSTCNANNQNDDIIYVDMYGYEHDGVDIMWENDYEDC